MKVDLTLINDVEEEIGNYKKVFKKIIIFVLKKLKIKQNVSLSVSFVDVKEIKSLNKQYRNIDKETDVLSFVFDEQLSEKEKSFYKTKVKIKELGDIVISYEIALKQATSYNHSLNREICFLFTHGLLHLLGYDHANIEEEKQMFSLQEEVLSKLGINR